MQIIPGVKQRFSDLEFWGLVSFFSVGVLLFSWQGVGGELPAAAAKQQGYFYDASIKFGYYKHYYIPNIFRYISWFACFMFLQFNLLSKCQEEGVKTSTLVKAGLIFLITLSINILTDIYLKANLWVSMPGEGKAMSYIFQSNFILTLWLFFAFSVYSLIKYGGLLLLSRLETQPSKIVFFSTPQVTLWIAVILSGVLLGVFVNEIIFLIWICLAPLTIIYSNLVYYKFIPSSIGKKRPKLSLSLWAVFMSVISWITTIGIIFSIIQFVGVVLTTALLHSFFLAFVVAPLLWYWYHFQLQRQNNLKALQQKLGHSTAQLDQLRNQINPHFLFNALNTVYGLAITEKAPQTSGAIEKVSEMMRFMLRENQEAFIPLNKDMDYLRNYITIQQMRLGHQPNVNLEYEIPEEVSPSLFIAPMIMIPFVENAFKHGISLQSPSFIHIKIVLSGNKLLFTLSNSTHARIWLNDPEKDNHGIGLNNVKQRLNLLYPDNHLLSVSEQDATYQVELTILL